MKTCIIYHNPRCSKSRKALDILQSHHIQPTIVEYLKVPFTLGQLKELRSHFNLSDFVRTNEPIFKQLNLGLADELSLLEAILKHPILLQRPIVIYGENAIIARPPEKVLELITNE